MTTECNGVSPSPEDLRRLREISDQFNTLSQEASKIFVRTLELPESNLDAPISRLIYTAQKGFEITRSPSNTNSDLGFAAFLCYQDPPGVCCNGPCPC